MMTITITIPTVPSTKTERCCESDRIACQGHRHVHDFSLLRLHHGGGTFVRDYMGARDQRIVVAGSGVHVGGERPRPSKLVPWVRGEEYIR